MLVRPNCCSIVISWPVIYCLASVFLPFSSKIKISTLEDNKICHCDSPTYTIFLFFFSTTCRISEGLLYLTWSISSNFDPLVNFCVINIHQTVASYSFITVHETRVKKKVQGQYLSLTLPYFLSTFANFEFGEFRGRPKNLSYCGIASLVLSALPHV